MTVAADRLVRVGRIEELKKPRIVSGGRHGIAVIADGDKVYAVDNRCPHMGFPLHRGSVCDGILTCHWHHARFDLASGGTFDPWADDVRVYDTVIEDGVVFVDPQPKPIDQEKRWKQRLHDGLEQNLNLLMVKSVLGLQEANVPSADVVEIGARFGSTFRRAGWGPGLTILTAMANTLPALNREEQALALYHGMVHVASDVSGAPPRFQLDPLPKADVPVERLKVWFRQFIEVRDSDGAERALLSAIDSGATQQELADMLLSAATDHVYLDGGHTTDFINKACEMLDLVGWDQASEVLPSVVRGLAMARRSEELNIWRHPVDLISLLDAAIERLEPLVQNWAGRGEWTGFDGLVQLLLDEDPEATFNAILTALETGAPLTDVSQTLTYAAGLRVARFHTSNEFSDWITVLHTFTYCNAVHQSLKRAPSAELARGIFHGAASLYLDRFLNMPAARLPEERPGSDAPATAQALLDDLLELTDREQRVNESATVVHRYLSQGYDRGPLLAALGRSLLREDAEFHSYQMYEAGLALERELRDSRPAAANHALIAVTRYLAAHAPTSRAMLQTARTALRLQRGESVYEDPDDALAAEG